MSGYENGRGKYKIVYLDMDGVLADFDKSFREINGVDAKEYEDEHGTVRFWNRVYMTPNFFRYLSLMPKAFEVFRTAKSIGQEVCILSSPSRVNESLCVLQKRMWLDAWLGGDVPAIFEKDKHKYAGKDYLLVDDNPNKVEKWKKAGGDAVLYVSAEQCLKDMNRCYESRLLREEL